jgi:hypothetical protein
MLLEMTCEGAFLLSVLLLADLLKSNKVRLVGGFNHLEKY